MRWPFVLRNWADFIEARRVSEVEMLTARAVAAEARCDAIQASYDALAARLIDRAFRVPTSDAAGAPALPADPLGPLARAALAEMSVGLPPANRRAQEAKAIGLAASLDDAAVAEKIRRGEPVKWLSVG